VPYVQYRIAFNPERFSSLARSDEEVVDSRAARLRHADSVIVSASGRRNGKHRKKPAGLPFIGSIVQWSLRERVKSVSTWGLAIPTPGPDDGINLQYA
jgi:hypothetical protein